MFDEGIQSYFGESDSNFFGDTSNDMIFGEGYGEQAVDGSQFFSEAVGFSSTGGEFINEATAFDMDGEVFTELDSSIPNSTNFGSHGRDEWVDDRIHRQTTSSIDAMGKAHIKALDEGASDKDASAAARAAYKKASNAHQQILDEERSATLKHMKGMGEADWKHFHDRRHKSKAKQAGRINGAHETKSSSNK